MIADRTYLSLRRAGVCTKDSVVRILRDGSKELPFALRRYHRQQVFAMLPEGVGELNCQVLTRFLNDALDAEVTRRLPRPRRYRHWTAILRRPLLIGVTWGSPPLAAIVLATPWRAG